MDGRKALKTGSILNFPGMCCVVQEEIGRGSNAMVYRGWYEDALMQGEKHHVLIKEMFPLHAKGLIYRDEDGSIRCEGEAAEHWQLHLESFERGNRAHLKLLEASPDTVGGNLNTFAFHNTCYTVLDYTGGRSLEQAMKLQGPAALRVTALRMLGVLRALRAFHDMGLVHLDISPDNALLIGQGENERVMLIDYNSVHSLAELAAGQAAFHSVKPGFSAPEVRVSMRRPIDASADMFSVAAVFYYCLSGHPLTPFDLSRREPPDVSGCDVLADAPDPVVRMVRTILARGLCPVPAKRYQSIDQMTTDLQELINRIDGVGITHWALWEAGRQQVSGMIRMNPAMEYIRKEAELYPARVAMPDGMVLPMEEAVDSLLEVCGSAALLTGPGGIGKTTALLHTACRLGKRYSPALPAVMYISLYGWTEENKSYITDRMLEYLRFRQGSQSIADARHALHALLSRPLKTRTGDRPHVFLLIDGLNEIPAQNDALLQELHMLSSLPGVGMLLSSRGEVSGMTLPVLRLSPLMNGDVAQVLSTAGLALPESEELQTLLCTPLMLSIFVATARGSGRQVMLSTSDELLKAYFQALQEKEEQDQGEGSPVRWQTAAAIHLVLPAIARACAKANRALTASELLSIMERCRRIVSSGYLKKLFPEWVGHSRDILGGTKNAEEWLGLMVQQILWQRLGLLLQDQRGGFRTTHQELSEYLQRVHAAQMKLISSRRARLWGMTAALLAALIALWGWGMYVQYQMRLYDENLAQSVYERAELAYLEGEKLVSGMGYVLENPEDKKALSDFRKQLKELAGTSDENVMLLDMMIPGEAYMQIPENVWISWDDIDQMGFHSGDVREYNDAREADWLAYAQNGGLELEDSQTRTLLDGFIQQVENGAYADNGMLIPWSGKPFNVEACLNLFLFPAERAEAYLLYLDMLDYAMQDDLAVRNGYYERLLPDIQRIVDNDAIWLVGSYRLACEAHMQKEWEDYRYNFVSESNYALYNEKNKYLTDKESEIEAAVKNAGKNRTTAELSTEYQMVMAGYADWVHAVVDAAQNLTAFMEKEMEDWARQERELKMNLESDPAAYEERRFFEWTSDLKTYLDEMEAISEALINGQFTLQPGMDASALMITSQRVEEVVAEDAAMYKTLLER